jgi:hypothetical protein
LTTTGEPIVLFRHALWHANGKTQMSQHTNITFNVIGVPMEELSKITDFLGMPASRMTCVVLGNREEIAWTYDIGSGPFSSQDLLAEKLNKFLKSKAPLLRELSRSYQTQIRISLADDEFPPICNSSLSPSTLLSLVESGVILEVGFMGACRPEAEK